MGPESTRPRIRRRIIAAAGGASLLVVLVVAGLAFAKSIGAARVAENAGSLHWANAALGTSSLTRAALVQAGTFVELEDLGLATEEDVSFAIEQAKTSHQELVGLEQTGLGSPSLSQLTHFNAVAGQTLAALDGGDHVTAEALIIDDVESAYVELTESLQVEQRAIQAEINANTEAAARTNDYIVFILTVAIPGAAVVTYWLVARRQVHEYRIKADADLEAERTVSRAKDSFIAGLSHELRTPLTSIYGFAEILASAELGDAEQGQDVARIIANEAAEMTRMVDDLLTASRLESTGVEIDLSPIRVDDAIESAATPFERAGAEIKRETSPDVVYADRGRLRHVLVNLLSNAVRHGGPIVGVEVSSGDGTVDIEVWDNGPGVPEEHAESLFERFIHDGTKPLLAGSVGLGLAVASRLTDMMGGSLSYRRAVDKTCFTVRLPGCEDVEVEAGDGESVAEEVEAMSS